MFRTRVFKSGNSQAVRIPAEIAFAQIGTELAVSRLGDVITLAPIDKTMAGAVAELRRLPKPPYAEFRDPVDPPDRKRD
ncbi:MAG: AbrB/MazE/SpoVT family DNA-binding domain-containing protein [Alphaproteobacteria bacterium]|nr:AbrB/MazE/SpoVT family DNA-binding domain-containing protein [Alphaproteobacteria bacterium]